MQFPVPQFTDVEDHIIGPLTIKQFGIVFAAGVVVFLGYSATKSVLVLVFLFILFGVPALALAFVKINGRPLYNTIGYFFKFINSPKLLIFHKETNYKSNSSSVKDAQISETKLTEDTVVPKKATFKEVQELLSKTAAKEREMIDKM
jgi:hypothetical protein